MRGCRSLESLIPRPDQSLNDFEWLSRCHEWRLNMQTGEAKEKDLRGAKAVYMDFPMINENFLGVKNRYAYTQVVDHIASSTQGNNIEKNPFFISRIVHRYFQHKLFYDMALPFGYLDVPKYGGLAKLYFEEESCAEFSMSMVKECSDK